jgi:hypothetical protein
MSEPLRYGTRGAIIYQTVDDETVILNLDNGRYYSLNATASAVWEGLMKGYTLDEIAASFAQPDAAALAHYLAELDTQELIQPLTTSPTLPPLAPQPLPFEKPAMEAFTDMEKLLPLDPIHQVGAMGWPHSDSFTLS